MPNARMDTQRREIVEETCRPLKRCTVCVLSGSDSVCVVCVVCVCVCVLCTSMKL